MIAARFLAGILGTMIQAHRFLIALSEAFIHLVKVVGQIFSGGHYNGLEGGIG